MTEKPTVNMKHTKQEIMKAYMAQLAKNNELEAQRFDPAKIKKAEARKAAITHVEEREWDISTAFAAVQKTISNNLRSIQERLEGEKEELDRVVQAKEAHIAELDELYGITKEAQTLAALIEVQKQRKEAFEEELAQRRAQMAEDMQDHKEAISLEREEWAKEKAEKEQDWEYEFTRECKRREDEFADSLEEREKAWLLKLEAENKQFEIREEALEKAEAEVANLRKQVESFPEQLEAAREEAKQKAKQSHEYEVRALKTNHDSDIKVMNHEVVTLREAKKAGEAKIAELETKLEAAYERIQGVASKALDAQGNANTTAQVQQAVASATQGKGR
jgi:hypothetical protein